MIIKGTVCKAEHVPIYLHEEVIRNGHTFDFALKLDIPGRETYALHVRAYDEDACAIVMFQYVHRQWMGIHPQSPGIKPFTASLSDFAHMCLEHGMTQDEKVGYVYIDE